MPTGTSRSCALYLLGGVLALAVPLPARGSTSPENPLPKVDFERHVMGLLSRTGCNAGSCHGSFQGKNGFRLSLFGADPAADHAALTHDLLGRRINLLDPDRSLLLLKATGQVAHGGGARFAPGSQHYRMFRDWIAAGTPRQPGSGDVVEMTLTPNEYAIIDPGKVGSVRARARFSDGSEEDITHLCDFRIRDDAVAAVQAPGVLRGNRPGDSALVVTYRGHVRALRVLVPAPAPAGAPGAKPPEVNYIDREVFAKLRLLRITPSELSGDAEFLRRVTIDTIGSLPSPDEVRAFLADTSPDKRTKKIDALLAHPLHAALWATRFSDITGNNTNALNNTGPSAAQASQMWHDWFRKRVADNVPYDEIVHGVLCATTRDGQTHQEWMKDIEKVMKEAEVPEVKGKKASAPSTPALVAAYPNRPSLDLFWKLGVNPTLEQFGERTAAAFLGVRLECAQCHKHPFDRWTQTDYRAYANIFGQVAVGVAPETLAALGGDKGKVAIKGKIGKGGGFLSEVYLGRKMRALPPPNFVPVIKEVVGDKKKRAILEQAPPPLLPRALGGPMIAAEPGRDVREALFAWMRAPENPWFARSFVNRVWAHYFGFGIVRPVDDFSPANPPTNARLLDALARDFVASKYDIRRLERRILESRVYQLSSTPNETNRSDLNNHSHSYVRPLLAEVVLDVLGDALGIPEDFGPDAPPGRRAIEVGSIRLGSLDASYALRVFGRSERSQPCDCERSTEPSLPQTLYRMADPVVLRKLGTAVPGEGKVKGGGVVLGKGKAVLKGRLGSLLTSGKTPEEILDQLFLATLSRFPSKTEKDHFARYLQGRKPGKGPLTALEREQVCTNALWALINTREFIVNH
jgi:hypothetical protein